jgi:hypothetical protein
MQALRRPAPGCTPAQCALTPPAHAAGTRCAIVAEVQATKASAAAANANAGIAVLFMTRSSRWIVVMLVRSTEILPQHFSYAHCALAESGFFSIGARPTLKLCHGAERHL